MASIYGWIWLTVCPFLGFPVNGYLARGARIEEWGERDRRGPWLRLRVTRWHFSKRPGTDPRAVIVRLRSWMPVGDSS
jgi:hypothetical protein